MESVGRWQRNAGRWAVVALIVTAVGATVIVWSWFEVPDAGAGISSGERLGTLTTVLAYGVVGAVLIDRRPDLPFGWLLAGAAASQVLMVSVMYPAMAAFDEGSRSTLVRWAPMAAGLGFVPIAVQGLVFVRFPTGRVGSRFGRVIEALLIAGTVMVILGGVLGAEAYRSLVPAGARGMHNPLTGGTAVGRIADVLTIGAPLVVLLGLVAGIGVVVRYTRAQGIERQQLKWMAVGILASFALFPIAIAEVTSLLDPIGNLVFVATLAIPVLRYRLWAIDTLLRRSAVYGLVTVALVAVYFGLTALGTRLFSQPVGAPVAAAATAIAFVPLRNRVQHFVDRVAFGSRADPYRTISSLDRRLSEITSPGQILPALVETIATSLRLPYVEIRRVDGSSVARHGRPGPEQGQWPLLYEGAVEGELVASPRLGEDQFDQRDRELLADLARHSGAAVHAAGLTADLLASRHRIVTAREEERRRLRRDLHDGLGPVLTAIGLNLDAARAQLHRSADSADRYLEDAKEATVQALDDVRRLVYDLRPPALDNLGLVGAVRLHAERLASDQAEVRVCADELPALQAAVEVACYRTAIEAITNALTARTRALLHCDVAPRCRCSRRRGGR